MTTKLRTEFSTYEVDQEQSLIRRLASTHPATRNQGTDGEWKPYWHLSFRGDQLLIEWGIDDSEAGEILRRTLTSNVLQVDGDPLDLPEYKGK